MTSTASAPAPGIDLERFDFYGPQQYEAYRWLQSEAPVYYYAPLDTWVVSRYEDVRYVGSTPELFSNTGALSLNMIRIARLGAGNSLDRFFDKSGEMVITLDPPRHRQIKRTLTPAFNPRAVRALADDIKQMCVDLADSVTPGEEIDFVPRIAARLPILVASPTPSASTSSAAGISCTSPSASATTAAWGSLSSASRCRRC
jgi:cytochrome P450